VLRVSAIPDEAPTELQRKFAPLGKYLEAQTGMKVVFTPVSDYAAVVESLATKKIDLAWLGGFTFVQAKIRTNGTAIPIAQREEDAKFTSKFITADPAIKGLADLKGKTFAFGAPSSTSGSLMPRFFLQQAGLNPEKDFKNVAFSGAHDATVAFVAAGKAEAGVLNASVWDKLVEQKKVDTDKVRVFATTPPYFDYNWTVRGDLDPVLVKKLTDAFLKLDPANPEHKEILGAATGRQVHSDQEGKLRRHRKGSARGRLVEVSFALNGVGLTHANGFTALSGIISLQAERGERIALIGPSGAGKTSLLSVLGTALAPSVGTLELLNFGRVLPSTGTIKNLRARIGTVHQAPPIPGRQRVVTAVLAGKLGQWPAWKSLASLIYPLDVPGARAALERVDLADKLFARCDQLSGGQLQRVGIARVLYQQADLILADEPVSALDPTLALATVRLLIADAEARGATLVASLHAVDLALSNFSRIVGVKAGRIAFDLPASEITCRCCKSCIPAKVRNCRCRRINRTSCHKPPPMMRRRGRRAADGSACNLL
jgi:phosphonate transport system substrate-binding protein